MKLDSKQRTALVSVEGNAIEWLGALAVAGYDKFQMFNQSKMRRGMWPRPEYEIEDEPKTLALGGQASGPCGFDLPMERWGSVHEAASLWMRILPRCSLRSPT